MIRIYMIKLSQTFLKTFYQKNLIKIKYTLTNCIKNLIQNISNIYKTKLIKSKPKLNRFNSLFKLNNKKSIYYNKIIKK